MTENPAFSKTHNIAFKGKEQFRRYFFYIRKKVTGRNQNSPQMWLFMLGKFPHLFTRNTAEGNVTHV